jgi:hypothetical protein
LGSLNRFKQAYSLGAFEKQNMSTTLYTTVEAIITLMAEDANTSSTNANAWEELVSNIDPNGAVLYKFTLPVENAVLKHLSNITDEDKRSIWRETEAGQKAEGDEEYVISTIEMYLQEELFAQVMDIAFEESEYQAH